MKDDEAHNVAVLIDGHTVGARQEAIPLGNAQESVVHGKEWSIALPDPGDLANDLVSLVVEAADWRLANPIAVGLIDEPEHLDDGAVLGLSDELRKSTDVVECALSIGSAHDA